MLCQYIRGVFEDRLANNRAALGLGALRKTALGAMTSGVPSPG
jgi:hypothetical protein